MAAMFQAQTQNWEETQEKMSQLVLPIAGFSFTCSSSKSNDECFFFFFFDYLIETVPLVSIPIPEGLVSVGENHIPPVYLTMFRTTGLCRLAMFAIVAERKVCPPSNLSPNFDTFYKAIGYKSVLQTTIASLTTDHG